MDPPFRGFLDLACVPGRGKADVDSVELLAVEHLPVVSVGRGGAVLGGAFLQGLGVDVAERLQDDLSALDQRRKRRKVRPGGDVPGADDSHPDSSHCIWVSFSW